MGVRVGTNGMTFKRGRWRARLAIRTIISDKMVIVLRLLIRPAGRGHGWRRARVAGWLGGERQFQPRCERARNATTFFPQLLFRITQPIRFLTRTLSPHFQIHCTICSPIAHQIPLSCSRSLMISSPSYRCGLLNGFLRMAPVHSLVSTSQRYPA